MIAPDKHLQIGSLAFDELDQMDLTGQSSRACRIPLTASSPCARRLSRCGATFIRRHHGTT
jgi:hypothetical protein